VSDDNCIELLALADLLGMMALKRAAIAHIKKKAASIIWTPKWERRISALSHLHREIVETALV
jgi:hypothetical protein